MTVYTDEANENTYTPTASEYAECANIAEFLALEVGTAAKLTLNNVQVNGSYWGGTFLEDASGAIQVTANINVNRNDVLNGMIYLVRGQDDFDTDHIIPTAENDANTSLNEVTITSDNVLEPTIMSINELPDNSNMSKLVAVQDVTLTKPSRFYLITTGEGVEIQLVDQMNVGGYDLESLVGKKVNVTGVFTWNMMRWAIFPTSVAESSSTAVTTVMSSQNDDADVYTITGVNLGKADVNTLPAGLYIKGGKKYLVK